MMSSSSDAAPRLYSLSPQVFYLDVEVDSVPKEQGAPLECITQIAVINEEGQHFSCLVKPPKQLRRKSGESNDTQNYTHDYTHGATTLCKYTFKKLWPDLKKWVNERLDGNRQAVFVMHNGYEHDWRILKAECARILDGIPRHWIPFDSLYLARSLKVSEDNSLTQLAHRFQVPLLRAHDAFNDATMLKGVFEKMVGTTPLIEVLGKIPGQQHPISQVASIIKTQNVASLVFFDFETTGLFPKRGEDGDNPRVVELAGYIPEKNVSFQTLVNPECHIPSSASKIHGIKEEDVMGAPTFGRAWTEFENWIGSHVETTKATIVLAGHNIWGYDLKVYESECERVGLTKKRFKSFDTLAFSRHLFSGIKGICHKLQALREMMGIEENQAHRAGGDVQVNFEVYKKFVAGVPVEKIAPVLLSSHPVLNIGQLVRDEGTFKPEMFAERKMVAIDSKGAQPAANSRKRGAYQAELKVPVSKIAAPAEDADDDSDDEPIISSRKRGAFQPSFGASGIYDEDDDPCK
jgi:DNA polymerase III epsilon subunit-like protein